MSDSKGDSMKFVFMAMMALSLSSVAMADDGVTKNAEAIKAAKEAKHAALIQCKQTAGIQAGVRPTREQFFSVKACMAKQGYKAKPRKEFQK